MEATLHLSFNDGTVQTVDFKPFLSLSRHPDIRAYHEPARFAAYRVEYGELVWGDYDLCFPVSNHSPTERGKIAVPKLPISLTACQPEFNRARPVDLDFEPVENLFESEPSPIIRPLLLNK